MAVQLSRVGATADLRLHVPRNDRGTLVDGARAVLDRVEAVDEVDALDVRSVRPDLNTVYTDVTVDLTLAFDRPVEDERAAVAAALRDAFGVETVEIRGVDPP